MLTDVYSAKSALVTNGVRTCDSFLYSGIPSPAV